jgi:hypothetical protein
MARAKSEPRGLEPAITWYREEHAKSSLAELLGLETSVLKKDASELARQLGAWSHSGEKASSSRDLGLVRGLLLELAGQGDLARDVYATVSEDDPGFEAALRARLTGLDPEPASNLLATLADASSDPTLGAVLLTEAALKNELRDAKLVDEWLERAVALEPAMAIAFRLGEQHARTLGDVERLVKWIRARREVTTDDVERSLDSVREALLTADGTPAIAGDLLAQTVAVNPSDIGLRELCERMTPGRGEERGAWREAAAEHATGPTRSALLLQAAFEYERAQNREGAARTARMAAESGGALAALTATRTAAGTPEAARVSESLLTQAKTETDSALQREIYEELSELDREQGDTASVILWQSAIVEQAPGFLPALRQLLRAYAATDREAEIEPILAKVAGLLAGAEGVAHARLAARFRVKAGSWVGRRELAELALARDPTSLWA